MNIGFIQKRKYKGGNPANGLSELCSTQVAIGIGATILTPQIKAKKGKYPLLINWGLTNIPWLRDYVLNSINKGLPIKVLNHPGFVEASVDKCTTFSELDGVVPIPSFAFHKDYAEDWFDQDEKAVVFCRTLPNSSQGRGIVIAKSKGELVDAPLYTLRVPKKWEYRVHVVHGNAIVIQQKKRLSLTELVNRGIPMGDGLIRSYNNGYTFSKRLYHAMSSQVVQDLTKYSINAVAALGLDFGAVDLLVTKHGEVRVLEVNTAPGVEGSTVEAYITAFQELAGE